VVDSKRNRQVATYLDKENHDFFMDVIAPRYGDESAHALRMLIIAERRRLENNATKEAKLDSIQDEVTGLKVSLSDMSHSLARLQAQNELLLMGILGYIANGNGEPLKLDKDIVRQVRELIEEAVTATEAETQGDSE